MDTVLIKLGGSIVTKKGRNPINLPTIRNLARQLPGIEGKIVIVHGTGHIGKPPALKYGYTRSKSLPPTKVQTALKIRNAIAELTAAITYTLNDLNIPALSIDNTHFYGYFRQQWNQKGLKCLIDVLTKSKVIPVFSGNFLPVENGGYRVLSSDELVLAIARLIKPKWVIFLSDVDGVFDAHNEIIPEFKTGMLNDLKQSVYDVSGGMKMKVKTALQLRPYCKTCFILNGTRKGILERFQKKKDIYGTRISFP
jgi:isopentenyl phosphate kinase